MSNMCVYIYLLYIYICICMSLYIMGVPKAGASRKLGDRWWDTCLLVVHSGPLGAILDKCKPFEERNKKARKQFVAMVSPKAKPVSAWEVDNRIKYNTLYAIAELSHFEINWRSQYDWVFHRTFNLEPIQMYGGIGQFIRPISTPDQKRAIALANAQLQSGLEYSWVGRTQ